MAAEKAMKFTPDMIMTLECEPCGLKEEVRLGDMPATPKGTFMLPQQVQCIKCLRVVNTVVRG